MGAADQAKKFGFADKARKLYRKGIRVFLRKVKTDNSFGDVIIYYALADILRAADRGGYSQKEINEICLLLIKVLNDTNRSDWKRYAKMVKTAMEEKCLRKGKLSGLYNFDRFC